MINIGQHILTSQNEDIHIDELLAQKNIYSRAKFFQGAIIFITVPLAIFMALLLKFYPTIFNEKDWPFIMYLIIALFSETILGNIVDNLKKTAAAIQENFDSKVLMINLNEIINYKQIDPELIRKFSKKSKLDNKEVSKMKNWYSINIQTLNTNIATILCQRTNIYYDFSMRKHYNLSMITFIVITSIVLLITSIEKDYSIKILLMEVLIPAIPIIKFAYTELKKSNESIDNLNHLKKLIENSLSTLRRDSILSAYLIRNIQDGIYNNRILSPLIPDFLYKIIRPKLEDEMNYSVDAKIKLLH